MDFFIGGGGEQELIHQAEKNSTVALGILVTIPVLLITILLSICSGKKKTAPVRLCKLRNMLFLIVYASSGLLFENYDCSEVINNKPKV